MICSVMEELESVFQTVDEDASMEDNPVGPYLSEPRSLREILKLPIKIQKAWLKTSVEELKFIIDNETLRRGVDLEAGDEVIPAILIFKAKVTSRGFLDKLKAHCVARGDLQQRPGDPDTLWSPCVFARTFKMFIAVAVKKQKPVSQLDFIGAFCQGFMKN